MCIFAQIKIGNLISKISIKIITFIHFYKNTTHEDMIFWYGKYLNIVCSLNFCSNSNSFSEKK